MTTKKQAERLAKSVLVRLGPGWEPKIWENLGWHVMWVNGAVSLHATYDHVKERWGYWGMVGNIGSPGTGHQDLTPRGMPTRRDPLTAVYDICDYAMDKIVKEWDQIKLSVAVVLLQTVARRRVPR